MLGRLIGINLMMRGTGCGILFMLVAVLFGVALLFAQLLVSLVK